MLYSNIDINNWLEVQLRNKETYDVEFKSAAGGFPASFWETYSSFANTEGGTIVLGIKEKDGLFSLDNLTEEQLDQYERIFWRNVNNREKVNRNLLTNGDVQRVELDGHHILLFFIPRASRELRPIYCTLNPDNGTYKRNKEGDFKCTPLEVRRMFADSNVDTPADSRILRNYSFDDIDLLSLEQFRRLFDLAKPGHAWLALDNLSLLKKLGGYRVDRKTGQEGFTVAGMLMFGKFDSIIDEECTPFFFPDYRELSDISPANERWIDRIYPDGTWEANIFQFYRRVLVKLQDGLSVPFKLEGDMRKDETPAHVAVREALINALIHTDYSIHASIVITKSKEMIEFTNPGSLLVSKQQYYEGGVSVCRNTSLQKMFMMLGRAEKAGSGADTIISGWEASNRRSPNIKENVRPDRVTLSLSMASFVDEVTINALSDLLCQDIIHIDQKRLRILALALQEGSVSNERLRYSLDMHRYDITQMLRSMCEEGLLVSEGSGRGTFYRLPHIASNVASNVASTSVKKRMSKEELYELIQTCAVDWVSLEVIAMRVGRTKAYLNNRIIPDMVSLGLLERRIPLNPKSPDQMYHVSLEKRFNKHKGDLQSE